MNYSNLVGLFGRQLFSIIFILSSASHFKPATVEYAAQHGVPFASALVPLSGIVALVGGSSVLLGYQTQRGAWLLVLFLIPVTLTMHNFWAAADARVFQIESALFLRNVALLGGALLIGHFGGGPLSLDALLHREKGVISTIGTLNVVAGPPQRQRDAKRQALDALDAARRRSTDGHGDDADQTQIPAIVDVSNDLTSQSAVERVAPSR